MTVYFIEQPDFFDRAGIYLEDNISYADNAERFIFFSKCVVHLARYLPWRPDVVHVHDWQTGAGAGADAAATARGRVGESAADLPDHPQSGVPGDFSAGRVCADESAAGIFHAGRRGILRATELSEGGNRLCRRDHTVSPRYAREITTEEMGCGLDDLLRRRQERLFGILNGVDYDEWNTTDNPFLAHALFRDAAGGQDGQQAGIAKGTRPAGGRKTFRCSAPFPGWRNKRAWTSNWARWRKC